MMQKYFPCNKKHIIDIMEISLNITNTPYDEWKDIMFELISDHVCKYIFEKGKKKGTYCLKNVKNKNKLYLYKDKYVNLCYHHKFKIGSPKYYKNKKSMETPENSVSSIIESELYRNDENKFVNSKKENNIRNKININNNFSDYKKNEINTINDSEIDNLFQMSNENEKIQNKIDVNYHFNQKDSILYDNGKIDVIPYIIKDYDIFLHNTHNGSTIYDEIKILSNIEIINKYEIDDNKRTKSLLKQIKDFNNDILKNTEMFKNIIKKYYDRIPKCEYTNCNNYKKKKIIYFNYCSNHIHLLT